jgi:predicted Zn-dependent protease
MGHVIARHVIELHTANAFAVNISRWFGYRGPLGSDLPTSRLQEVEADHIGLVIMAEAGFDPHERVDYVSSLLTQELEHLKGREPTPEFLCTHPSVSYVLAKVFSLLTMVQS